MTEYILFALGCLAYVAMIAAGSSRHPDSPEPHHDAATAAEQSAPRGASQYSPEPLGPTAPVTFTDGAGI